MYIFISPKILLFVHAINNIFFSFFFFLNIVEKSEKFTYFFFSNIIILIPSYSYCVRPNAAIVQPGESLDVSIILQGLKEEPKPDYKCKDKFLVVTLPCPYDLDEAKQTISQLWPTLEKQYKEQSVSKKIRVVFKISETKTQSIDESIPVPAPAKSEPAPVEKQIPTSEKSENVKFEKVESTTDSTSSPAISAENTSSSLNTVVISLLVALIAFLFWLLF